ncbi:PD-(D/E)XK nuclease family protein [Sorangium sp. So ce448]|uniref:PD-(D/E)XK nuclease family protein n=1 Tax=Sorangium sp. So ce448 TaxID=3133314 RepID=UPI003F63A9C6
MGAPSESSAAEIERGARAVDAIAGAWRDVHRSGVGVQVAVLGRIASVGLRTIEQRGRELLDELERQLDTYAKVGVAPPLFRVMGLNRFEKPYNRALAWLLDPAAEHGAGRAVLQVLARHIRFDALLHDVLRQGADVHVRGERPWPPEAASMREPDLLVLTEHAVLLIENKVESGESGQGQYSDYRTALKKLAAARDLDARAYLLTPDASETPESWHGVMTHAELADAIDEASRSQEVAAWDRALCTMVSEAFRGDQSTAARLGEAKRLRAQIARRGLALGLIRRLADLLPLPDARNPFGDPR